jgi:sulfonate transport system substrate-binding protein
VFALWAKAGNVPIFVHRRQFEGLPLAQRLSPLFDDFIVAHIGRGARDALKYKLIRKPVAAEEWIDTTYLADALNELRLEAFWPRYDREARLAVPR